MDLLLELRVAAIGVHVLFRFLLALLCTTRFILFSSSQRYLYVAVLVLGLASVTRRKPGRFYRLAPSLIRGLSRAWCLVSVAGPPE